VDRPSIDEYREFVCSRSASLVHLAFWMTGNWQDAEDIVQDALVKAYVRWPGTEHPEAYVRRIVLNGCRRRFRSRRREALLAEQPDEPAAAAGVDEAVIVRRTLVAALASLPGRQRAVIVLRYCLDQPEAEVAAALGCSAGTVKSQASKALARLRSHPALAPEGETAPARSAEGDP
jgi:RNA polymerase sigma-70 factor (sigma-E family)